MSERIRRFFLVTATACLLGTAAVAPSIASAGLVNGIFDQVNSTVDNTVNNLGGSAGSTDATPAPAAAPEPKAGTPPSYVPPAHGTNPHAQGTGIVADLTPEQSEPLPYDPGGGSEDAVVGRSRGEQKGNDKYHGHVTIVGLLGTELIEGADTNQGESSNGPLGDVNAQLNSICTASAICLTALDVHSQTTKKGSTNSFDVATASVGLGGTPVVSARAVHSDGTIFEDSQCQTSDGESEIANAGVFGGAVNASALNSRSSSVACDDGSSTQQNDSSAVDLNGVGVLAPLGCADGTPNQNFGVPLILDLVCGADDSSTTGGDQNTAPYGVREALTAFPLTGLIKATTAASESHAVAPDNGQTCAENPNQAKCDNGQTCAENPNQAKCDNGGQSCAENPDQAKCPNPGNGKTCKEDPDQDKCEGAAAPPNRPTAKTPSDALPFTGAELGTLSLIGLSVMAIGLGLMAVLDRRRRQARLG